MKNNRQIGLNGRVFISSCLKRGAVFVFLLMLGGISTAVADILKLTGASGAYMSSFTTTLLLYDFICSLLLVVVMFYAYFLECGDPVPIVRERPLVIFGCIRLGYLILLSYYICYRALYCIINPSLASPSLCIFYLVYFIFIFLCILANCFIFNILTRNIIRRSYIKSFHTLSTMGLILQVLLPISYIIARVTMKDIGDEYFTSAMCDLLRLCLCPICTVGLWFLFVNSIGQVSDIFSEVDTALREKRYQITYTAPEDEEQDGGKKLGKPSSGKQTAAALTAAIRKQLPSASGNAKTTPAQPSQPVKKLPPKPEVQKKVAAQPIEAVSQSDSAQKTAPVKQSAVKEGDTSAVPVVNLAPVVPVDVVDHSGPNGEPQITSANIIEDFNPYPDSAPVRTAPAKQQPVRTPVRQQHTAQPAPKLGYRQNNTKSSTKGSTNGSAKKSGVSHVKPVQHTTSAQSKNAGINAYRGSTNKHR